MQELKVLEGAEEFTLGQGPTGALLVHGFTGAPQSMRPLGEHLAAAGIAVFGVRLPGHGTTWQDLGARSPGEWTEAVEAAFDRLRTEHDEVFLVGLSFGVALCLDLAGRRSGDIAGLVSLAGFLHTPDPRRFLAPVLKRVLKSVPAVGNDICDPDSREICYERVPTSAAYSMLRFVKGVRTKLPAVRCPVLVVHSRNDHTAVPKNAEMIYRGVGSVDKDIVWLERSYHVITLDHDRADVYDRTLEFIRTRSKVSRGI